MEQRSYSMSKKRIAASILIVILAIAANILIICYKDNAPQMVTLQMTIHSDQENDMEIFYLVDEKATYDQSNSALMAYDTPGETVTLEYQIPSDTKLLRFDLGTEASQTQIENVSVAYGNKTCQISMDLLSDVENTNQIDSWNAEGNGMEVMSQSGDPHMVWCTGDWGMTELTADSVKLRNGIIKGILCVLLDVMALFCICHAKKLLGLPLEVWQNRKLIWQLSKNDFKTKFAGSYLGTVWAFIQPIVTVLVYWFVFEKGLKAGGINTKAGIAVPFVLWLVAGLVPWFFFQDALIGGTNALTEYSYLVKKVVFKISILPIVKVMSALFVHVFFIAFTLCLYAAYGYFPNLYMLQILYYSFCTFVLVLGLSYMTSAIVGFFKDLTQVINIILQVGVWMTPIMWNIDTMELSPVLITIFKLNPMYYVVAGYRDALINQVWFWEKLPMTLYFWIVTILVLILGTTIFKRLKVHFADVL